VEAKGVIAVPVARAALVGGRLVNQPQWDVAEMVVMAKTGVLVAPAVVLAEVVLVAILVTVAMATLGAIALLLRQAQAVAAVVEVHSLGFTVMATAAAESGCLAKALTALQELSILVLAEVVVLVAQLALIILVGCQAEVAAL
jgi:hypothetical protein